MLNLTSPILARQEIDTPSNTHYLFLLIQFFLFLEYTIHHIHHIVKCSETCVLCVSGDGGFQMNVQELATVHRLGLPIKMVIIDNKYLGMVRQWQQLFYQRNYAETDLSDNPDFVAISKAYKIHGQRISESVVREFPMSKETGDELDRFLNSSEPEMLVFDTHPEANVFPMVPAGAALSEMMFEE